MPNVGNRSSLTGNFVLDSFALLAFFEEEAGSFLVSRLLEEAKVGSCHLEMCLVNFGEVVYIIERERGLQKAQEIIARIDELPINMVAVDRRLTLAAAHLKTDCPIAYADCYAAALSQLNNAVVVTGDPEFKKIKPECNVMIQWIDTDNENGS